MLTLLPTSICLSLYCSNPVCCKHSFTARKLCFPIGPKSSRVLGFPDFYFSSSLSLSRSTAVIRSVVNTLLLHVNFVFRLDPNQVEYSVIRMLTLLPTSICLSLYCSNPVCCKHSFTARKLCFPVQPKSSRVLGFPDFYFSSSLSLSRSTAVIRSVVNTLLLHVNFVFRLDPNQVEYSVIRMLTLLPTSICLSLYCSNPQPLFVSLYCSNPVCCKHSFTARKLCFPGGNKSTLEHSYPHLYLLAVSLCLA
ncbi:hypothetical protein J6590_043751 [Homalodisca vitripennis]|nr:hypothetical protein J6590_043751 [Homalodisca vitripennis]